jgi:hypothetical protein
MRILYKQKILLAIIQELNETDKNLLQNLVYNFICQKKGTQNIYYFNNLNNQPYSFELENDIQTLTTKNTLSAKRYATELDLLDKFAVQHLKNTKNETFKIPEIKLQENTKYALYTIGYEGVSIDEYINKLLKHNIKILCDVRKNAYSNKFGFSKDLLQKALNIFDIKYFHLPNLGIESSERKNLVAEKNHTKLFADYRQKVCNAQNAKPLIDFINSKENIAITCFEKDHNLCHRGTLSQYIKEELEQNNNFAVVNI